MELSAWHVVFALGRTFSTRAPAVTPRTIVSAMTIAVAALSKRHKCGTTTPHVKSAPPLARAAGHGSSCVMPIAARHVAPPSSVNAPQECPRRSANRLASKGRHASASVGVTLARRAGATVKSAAPRAVRVSIAFIVRSKTHHIGGSCNLVRRTRRDNHSSCANLPAADNFQFSTGLSM